MKKIFFLILLLNILNCSSQKDLPHWVLNPYIKNGISAAGIAYPKKIGEYNESQKLIAQQDGQKEIAKIIHTKLSRISSDILGQISFKNPQKIKNIFDQATNEAVKNIPIEKSSVVDRYVDKYGVLYVRLFLKNADYQNSNKAMHEIYQKYVNQAKLKNQDKENANEAVKAMFGYSKNHYWFHRNDLY